MPVILSGSRRSPEKRRVANAMLREIASADLVINVANQTSELVRDRAVIPYGDTISAAQSGPPLNAMHAPPSSGRVIPRSRLTSLDGFPRTPPNYARHVGLYRAHQVANAS